MKNTTIESPQQQLVTVYEEKLQWLMQVLELSKAQPEALEKDETHYFERNINERTYAFSQIAKLDDLAARLAAELKPGLPKPENADAGTLRSIKRVGELNEEIRTVARKIIEFDKENFALATAKLDGYRTELRNVRQSIASDNAYHPIPISGDGRYFDTKK